MQNFKNMTLISDVGRDNYGFKQKRRPLFLKKNMTLLFHLNRFPTFEFLAPALVSFLFLW